MDTIKSLTEEINKVDKNINTYRSKVSEFSRMISGETKKKQQLVKERKRLEDIAAGRKVYTFYINGLSTRKTFSRKEALHYAQKHAKSCVLLEEGKLQEIIHLDNKRDFPFELKLQVSKTQCDYKDWDACTITCYWEICEQAENLIKAVDEFRGSTLN